MRRILCESANTSSVRVDVVGCAIARNEFPSLPMSLFLTYPHAETFLSCSAMSSMYFDLTECLIELLNTSRDNSPRLVLDAASSATQKLILIIVELEHKKHNTVSVGRRPSSCYKQSAAPAMSL